MTCATSQGDTIINRLELILSVSMVALSQVLESTTAAWNYFTIALISENQYLSGLWLFL